MPTGPQVRALPALHPQRDDDEPEQQDDHHDREGDPSTLGRGRGAGLVDVVHQAVTRSRSGEP